MNKNTRALLHVSLIPGVGPATTLQIIRTLAREFYEQAPNAGLVVPQLDLQKLYTYTALDFSHLFGISKKYARILVDGLADTKKFDTECTLIEKYHIEVLSFLDAAYPESLKHIHHPPLVLYCKGAPLRAPAQRLAIVGARKADTYAYDVIDSFVPELVAQGWEIVSGGAIGVDGHAHQATLTAGGTTLAVFGSGLCNPYPASNKELFRTIIRSGGTLISPFSLNTPPDRGHFPARNRIISGLSDGCLIVQAAEKSGALITGQFALEQGRQVFAIPGDIAHPLSAGCHRLIQSGAKLVTNALDIIEEFGINIDHPAPVSPKKKEPKKEEPESDPILKILNRSYTLDEITYKTGLSIDQLHMKLFELQLSGKVKQNFAGSWEPIKNN